MNRLNAIQLFNEVQKSRKRFVQKRLDLCERLNELHLLIGPNICMLIIDLILCFCLGQAYNIV